MTVESTVNKSGPYAGAGSPGPFTVGFRFLDQAHLRVIKTSASGVNSDLILTTDYSVSGVGDPTGSVTLTVALAVGEQLTIVRNVPFTQEADYVQNDAFPAESHEAALDKLTMAVQQLDERVGAALTLPPNVTGASTELPIPESNKIIGWNEDASALQNVDPGTIATLVAYGTTASDLFSGDALQTDFVLSQNPGAINNMDVAIGGVTQRPGVDYTWAGGTTLSFTVAPPVGTQNVLVRYSLALPQGTGFAEDIAFTQTGPGAAQTSVSAKLREYISVTDFGAVGDGTTDDWAAISAADAVAKVAGKRVYFPASEDGYATTKTLLCSVEWFGERNIDIWGNAAGGSRILTSGAGTGAVWTDVNGADAAIKPCVVFANNEAGMRDMTVRTVSPYWDAALFAPGTRRNKLRNVYTSGNWAIAGLYLDATWSAFNTTLTALHPEIESNAGPLEFSAYECFFQGGKWGVACIGTTRNPDLYGSDPTVPGGWVWGYGGTSDMSFTACRFGSSGDLAARQADGGCFLHDAKMKNAAKAGQGHWFSHCSFRSYSKHIVKLAVSNRDGFVNCYGEMAATDLGFSSVFAVTTPTVAGYGDVQLVDCQINAPVTLDGVEVAASFDLLTYAATRRISYLASNGDFVSPHIQAAGVAPVRVNSRFANGECDFYYDTGSGTPTRFALLANNVFRGDGAAGAIALGSAAVPFGLGRFTSLAVGTSPVDATISMGTGSPEGVVTARQGSLFLRQDGGATTSLYVKTSGGVSNTGWTAK